MDDGALHWRVARMRAAYRVWSSRLSGLVRPQEVNWMTAGRGITHSERFEHARVHGDHLHGIQPWVALPTEQEGIAPSFSHHAGLDLPQWDHAGVVGQLIAGSAYGLTARAETHSPLFYAHLDMAAGATAEIPGGYEERAIYIATGAVELGGMRYESDRILVLGSAASRVRALERSKVMVLGGDSVGERFIYWNFVSSSKDRLAQAASDWKAGKMKLPDAEGAESSRYRTSRRHLSKSKEGVAVDAYTLAQVKPMFCWARQRLLRH